MPSELTKAIGKVRFCNAGVQSVGYFIIHEIVKQSVQKHSENVHNTDDFLTK